MLTCISTKLKHDIILHIKTNILQQVYHARRVALSALAICSCVFTGTAFFYYNEDNCSIGEAFYLAFTTTTTVGYGDLSTRKASSRAFLVVYTLFSVILLGATLSNIVAIQAEVKAEREQAALLNKKMDVDMLRKMTADGEGISEMEFLICMLVQVHVSSVHTNIILLLTCVLTLHRQKAWTGPGTSTPC